MTSKDARATGSLKDQLRPLKDRMRKRYASVVPVSQVSLTVSSKNDDACFDSIVTDVLKWTSPRAGRDLPAAAWDMSSFETEEPGAQRVAAVKLEDPKIWAARIDDACSTVARRTWITEVAVAQHHEGGVLVGARLTCTSSGDNPQFKRSIPKFIRKIIQNGGASVDGRALGRNPWLVSNREDVTELVAHLRSPQRRRDTILVSLPEGSADIADAAVDVADLYRDIAGAAHVAVLTGDATYHLTGSVGKEFSVFSKGVRTYRPGFDPEHDEYIHHPLGLWRRIESWEGEGPQAYCDFLVNRALSATVSKLNREEELPSFSALRALSAKQRREQARISNATADELLALAEQELEKLESETAEITDYYDGELEESQRQLAEVSEQRDKFNQTIRRLNERVRYLESALGSSSGHSETPIPKNTDEFSDWCDQHLSGKVEVLSRARRAVKKSVFEDVELIYRSLLLLRDYYVPLKRGELSNGHDAYDARRAELGLEETQTFTSSGAGEQGDTYFVTYDGQRCALERHLKKSTSRDPRYCFRLYFFWHQNSEQAVVGWLPSHLETRAS